jgi:hypothetical protein
MSDERGVEERPLRLLSLGTVFIFTITHVLIISVDGGGIRGYSEYAQSPPTFSTRSPVDSGSKF